ncbi:hypothetical protein AAFF_G00180000 [Aldrovandia affinis]|uniref:Uncharacterized protein n=1 Tax=Aldrovandia affinis TaxID=143900 RepID=A0AAD7SYE7_9TELE|nr:hypothetical protein AAFF_G00180000 [Aldrovandia affinis]
MWYERCNRISDKRLDVITNIAFSLVTNFDIVFGPRIRHFTERYTAVAVETIYLDTSYEETSDPSRNMPSGS